VPLVIVVDMLSVSIALLAAYDLRFQTATPPWALPRPVQLGMFGSLVTLFLCMVYLGGYRVVTRLSFQRQVETVARCVFIYSLLTASVLLSLRLVDGNRLLVLTITALVPFALFLGRIGMHRLHVLLSKKGIGVRRAAVLGTEQTASQVFRRFARAPELGYEIVGIIADEDPFRTRIPSDEAPTSLGTTRDLAEIAVDHQLDLVFTLEWNANDPRHVELVDRCRSAGLNLRYLSDHTDRLLERTRVHDLTGVSLVVDPPGAREWMHDLLKRGGDFLGSLFLLMLVSPIAALIALAIRLDSRGPALFRQARVTAAGRGFDMFKFRTMVAEAEHLRDSLEASNEAGGLIFKIRRDPRVTRVGRILRKTSLDELPQLLNVLSGEMSLVGPRPALPGEVAGYEDWQRHRLRGRQGMTGLWQISGRSAIGFEEMVLLDLYYLENRSLLFDIEILMATIPAVLFARGAY